MKVPKLPGARGIAPLLTVGVVGGLGVMDLTIVSTNVDGGHRSIVFNRLVGIKDKVYPEGTHLIIPCYEGPVIYDVRAKPCVVESKAGSRDLQMLPNPAFITVRKIEGEATSAKLISQVIANNPAFITLRKIEAAREIAPVISDSKNKIYLERR